MDGFLFRKANFALRGVHIHIHTIRIDFKKHHELGLLPLGEKRTIAFDNRMGNSRTPNRPAIDEEFLWRSRRLRVLRIDDDAAELRSRLSGL